MTIAMERPTSTLHELNAKGDTSITWNPDSSAEVEAAREHFDRLRATGYLAYALNPGDEAGEQLREFDPAARQIIMSPQLQGG